MKRFGAIWVLAAVLAASPLVGSGSAGAWGAEGGAARRERKKSAPKGASKKKPAAVAERESAPAQPAAAESNVPAPATAEELEQRMAEARADRDRQLDEAAVEKDPARLEEKKRAIFGKYAAIAAAMRDAYAAKQAAAAAAPPAAEANKPAAGAAAEPQAGTSAGGGAEDAAKKRDDLKQKLAAVEQKLADETARHEAKLQELRQKEQEATAAGKTKPAEKARKSIEKENAGHETKKSVLGAQRFDLQRQIDALPAK